jgi:hypothetical protein
MSDLNEQVLAELGDLLATHYEDMQAIGEDRPEITLGRYLRACRKWQVLTITEMAAIANVPASEILAYEQGLIPKRRIKIDSLQALAGALDESIERFVLLLEAGLVTEKESGCNIPWKHRFLSRLSTYISDVRQIQAYHLWRAVAIVTLLFCFHSTYLMAPAPGQSTEAAVAGYTNTAPLVPPNANEGSTEPLAAEQRVATTIRSPARAPVANQSPDSTTAAAPGSELAMAGELPIPPARGATRHPFLLEATSPPSGETMGAIQDQPAANVGAPGKASLSQDVGINPALAANANPGWLANLFTGAPDALADALATQVPLDNSMTVVEMDDQAPRQELVVAPQLLHTITLRENPWCIAMKYYELGSLYPLICLYNFGNSECGGSLQPGKTLVIPTIENFTSANGQSSAIWEQTRARELEQLKTISTDFMRVNQSKLRGIDYFCEQEDYEKYGAPLIAAGQVKAANGVGRIP